jgi:hypothetical protein
MPRAALYLVLQLFFLGPLLAAAMNTAPLVKKSDKTDLGFGLGLTRSVVYLARNVKTDNDATGLNATLVYGLSRLFRASLEYTYYLPLDIAPTWYDIRANTIEMNMHILARFKSVKAYFYPMFGISYNTFSGRFTGVEDYLNLSKIYDRNQQVKTTWFGLNIGTGYELFFKPGSFFLDYKMRVGVTEGYNNLNIQDICVTAGLRFNVRVVRFGKWFRGTRSRYLLNTRDEG